MTKKPPTSSHEFQLTAREFDFLRTVAADELPFAQLLAHREERVSDKIALHLDHTGAEQLREYLTKRLAAVGFDKDYSVTKEGKMLEALIDKFYLPK